MSGGGGSSAPAAPTTTTVRNESLPAYAQPYVERALRRAETESLQPYTPYGGQRLGYFSPDELNAQAMTRGDAGAGTPSGYGDAGTRYSGIGSYDPIAYNQENISGYMSPYQQNVTDIQKREAIRQSDMMGNRVSDAATKSGGLGGYRDAIMQSERQRNLGTKLDDIQAKGSQSAFANAQAQMQRDRQSQSQAYDLSSRYGLMAGDAQMGLADATSQDATNRIQALGGIGMQQRAMRQAGLDMGYDDFMNQRGYPQQQLGFYSNMIQGLPVQGYGGTRDSTYNQQPGLFQGMASLGLGGLGLYKGMQG